ncbi:VOC family protein [Billgrantia diversa]|uniref:SMU1112c/YaeR family gloxylase I-like metalloprotein n=1 Tax=Halomonas sp. MCCC 1A13316 TaxID=2733487 RepID=UPI0018A3F493|nr:VOC family protein [Halomonas sp. MCCC 1A13316]QOR40453.1 VOC family protein [Halomonas sp. MCCC 1A13316]
MSTAPLPLSGVHHIALITADYPRAKCFYIEVLGADVISETYRAERDSYKLDLRLPGGIHLELFSFPEPPARQSYPEACGWRHLALATTDLDACMKLLQARGARAEPIRIDALTGSRFTFMSDPDGTPIELYEEKRQTKKNPERYGTRGFGKS